MGISTICIIGGGGFVGQHIAARLAAQDKHLRIPARRRERAKALLPLPTAEVVEADIHDPETLGHLFEGVDAVINLVGILHGSRRDFERAHVELPEKIVAACQAAGVKRLLHMSALGADIDSASRYQQTKARGEARVRAAGEQGELAVTVFRPSVIFGPGDSFLNLFAQMLRLMPVMPLTGAWARFQPVYVGDVARAFADSLENPATFGQTYNLCGPQAYSLEELVRLTADSLGLKRTILPLGRGSTALMAALIGLKPGKKLMTLDNYRAMLVDNVCPEGFPAVFGPATPLEAVIGYLREQNPRGVYMAYRTQARR